MGNVTLVFRDATLDDIPAMVQVEAAFPYDEDTIGPRQLRYLITKGHADVMVAERDGEVVAYAVVLLRNGSSVAHGWAVVVLPEHRHNGVTTALFAWEEARLLERGYRAISFEVRDDNAEALRLYEKFGYVIQEELTDHFGPGRTGWRMVKELHGV